MYKSQRPVGGAETEGRQMRTKELLTGAHVITKPNCGKCDELKARLPTDIPLEIHSFDDVEGMALVAFHEAKYDPFPVLIYDNEKITGVINILRFLSEKRNGRGTNELQKDE